MPDNDDDAYRYGMRTPWKPKGTFAERKAQRIKSAEAKKKRKSEQEK